MSLSDFYPQMEGWTPAASIPKAPQSPNPETQVSPYLRTTTPLLLQYTGDTVKQYNRPGLSSFRISPIAPAGIPTINSTAAGVSKIIIQSTPSSGSGGLSSVGLSMPIQFSVSNSPLTSDGTIGVAWTAEPFGTYLGVSSSANAPFPDATSSNTSATTSTSISLTTGSSTDELVLYMGVAGTGGSAVSSPTGGTWTNIDNGTNTAQIWYQVFGANSTVSETAAYTPAGGATAFVTAAALVSLGCSATPVVTVIAGGQHGSVLNGAQITATVSAGQTLFAIIEGSMLNANTRVGSIQDSQGNLWFPLVDLYDGVSFSGTLASAFISLWYCPSPKTGSTTWTLELSTSATGGSGMFRMFSVTNLAPSSGTPTFKYIAATDLRGQVALVNGGTGANLANTGGAHQYVAQLSTGAALSPQQPDFSDLAGASGQLPPQYNGMTTVGNGFPFIMAQRNSTNQSSNQAATNFFGGGSTAGLYRVSVYLVVTQAATSSSTLPDSQIIYTDRDSSGVITIAATPSNSGNTTSTMQQTVLFINVKSGTNIQFAWGQVTPYASTGATSMLFAYRARLEYMGA